MSRAIERCAVKRKLDPWRPEKNSVHAVHAFRIPPDLVRRSTARSTAKQQRISIAWPAPMNQQKTDLLFKFDLFQCQCGSDIPQTSSLSF